MNAVNNTNSPWPLQIDFAHVVGNCLLVYGWVAGLATKIDSARLQVGTWKCDLLGEALLVARPDVSSHFLKSSPATEGDDHGFFLLHELKEPLPEDTMLRLNIRTNTGVALQREWPIVHGKEAAAKTLRQHERAIRLLISRQSPRQVRLLTGLFNPPLLLRANDLQGAEASFGPPLHVPIACLVNDVLVLAGTLPWSLADFQQLDLVCDGQVTSLLDVVKTLPSPTGWPLPVSPGTLQPSKPSAFVAAISLPAGAALALMDLNIEHKVRASGGSQHLSLRSHPQDVQARLWSWLNSLDAQNRVVACEALFQGFANDNSPRQVWQEALELMLAESIPHLPASIEAMGGARVYVENTVAVPGAGLMLVGWAHVESGTSLTMTYHCDGLEYPVSDEWVRVIRPDVREHLAQSGLSSVMAPGFFCLVQVPDVARPGYLKVTSNAQSYRLRTPPPPAIEAGHALVRHLLSLSNFNGSDNVRTLLERHIGPAVSAAWAAKTTAAIQPVVKQYGPRVEQPTVTVVVPLYGRHDLADYQLALFADDPDFQLTELIYVVDDPNMVHEFQSRCPDLYAMYGVPFTLAYPGSNLGYAGATNLGAKLATAPMLLLLNSDVMPLAPGWLAKLCERYRAHPSTGLMGAKLLYEDGTIQHAGMCSRPHPEWQGLWINHHPHKGLRASELNGCHEVPAVTAACVLVETIFYHALGGLSEDYIIGDFEDSDLCYRAREAGRPCRVDLDVSLYHLERQSQNIGQSAWRQALTMYNCWLHDTRWGQDLEKGRL
jgi:O-antigen biosynthesis protein